MLNLIKTHLHKLLISTNQAVNEKKWAILSFLSKAPALSLITSASVIQSGRKVESLFFEIQKKEREQNILHQNLAKKKNSTHIIRINYFSQLLVVFVNGGLLKLTERLNLPAK
jgi:hypothetical protein